VGPPKGKTGGVVLEVYSPAVHPTVVVEKMAGAAGAAR
jgi:hypothetical protein